MIRYKLRVLVVLWVMSFWGGPLLAAELWRLDAPADIQEMLLPWLPPIEGLRAEDADAAALEKLGLVRRLRERIPELLATQGYFSPALKIDAAADPVVATLVPGAVARVVDVSIIFAGALGEASHASRAEPLRSAWLMPIGSVFRQQDWGAAKTALQLAASSRDFPGAKITQSLADADPLTGEVRLAVTVDSGPIFYFGPLQITGLSKYSPELVARYQRFTQGEPYSQEKLLSFQTALQATPYFSVVEVTIDTDSANAAAATVRVAVTEAKPYRAGVGVGFSTNTGWRSDINFSDANLFDRAWQLNTGARVESVGQGAFADVFLPPTGQDFRYSVGALVERNDIQNLAINRQVIGLARSHEEGRVETRVGLSLEHEARQAEGAEREVNQALALTGGWTYRRVDNPLDPRAGYVLNLQMGVASKYLLSDASFVRSYGRLVTYASLSPRDVLTARIEGGYTAAQSSSKVPEDFLFRTGGAQTVRGYSYLSLGQSEGEAIVGGRYMAVGSVEYTRWVNDTWGVATFVDVGDASDAVDALRAKVGLGLGARWRSPAGPLAIDLAWGVASRSLHLHLAIAVAF